MMLTSRRLIYCHQRTIPIERTVIF